MDLSMEMYDFIAYTKPEHLKLGDVKKLSPGDILDVVIWDRNWEEYWVWDRRCLWDKAEENKPYNAEDFFKFNRHQLIYCGDMRWNIKFEFGETILHPIHMNTEQLQTTWDWVPLDDKDGKIHITNEIVNKGEKIPSHWKPKHIHWTEFPDSTRVGRRGPIMLRSNLAKSPKIYFKYVSKTEQLARL